MSKRIGIFLFMTSRIVNCDPSVLVTLNLNKRFPRLFFLQKASLKRRKNRQVDTYTAAENGVTLNSPRVITPTKDEEMKHMITKSINAAINLFALTIIWNHLN